MLSQETVAAEQFVDPHDKLGLGETLDIVAGLGNNEVKALLLLYLHDSPYYMNCSQMGMGFKEFVGPGADWTLNITGAYGYCKQSLEPIGQVVKGRVETPRGWSQAYAISEKGKQKGVPLAALVLEWSLANPDISLQRIFGATNTSSQIRAPQSRIEVIAELLTAPKEGISLADLSGLDTEKCSKQEYRAGITSVDSAARALEKSGIVKVDHQIDNNSRRFEIIDPEIPAHHGPTKTVTTLALYAFIEERYTAGKPVFTFEECLEFSVAYAKIRELELDEADIRKNLSITFNSKSVPGLKRIDSYNEGGKTKVTLNEIHRAPLERLLETLVAVEEADEPTIKRGFKVAHEIIADTSSKEKIMNKVKRFSPYANKQPLAQTAQEILGILATGSLDAESIIAEYNARHERSLSKDKVRSIMRILEQDQQITVKRARARGSIKHLHNFYSLSSSGDAKSGTHE